MDPASFQAAMNAFQSMPESQRQRLMSQMGTVTPDMLSQAQAMASQMRPEDWQRASQQMSQMQPEELERQATQAQAHFTAQQKYTICASQQLKNEGNQLHSAGSYAQAIEKYERAKQNLASQSSSEAAELRRACTLNLSSCYLNLKDWSNCVAQCNEVLAGEPENLKALYRRGQAYMGIAGWAQAVEDLGRALKLSAGDPPQQQLIREKLQDAKDQLSSQRAAAALQPSTTAQTGEPGPTQEATAAPTAPASGNGSAATSATASGTSAPHMDPALLQAAAEQMRSNPDWANQVEETMRGMSDEQLQSISSSMGHEIRRDQLNLDWARNLSPEQLSKFSQFQQQMLSSDVASRLRANPADPEALAATTRMMQDNPDMMGTMADMLANMTPDQLNNMARQAGMPTQSLTPEMIKTAASTFKKMKPEELQAMTEMAARMRPPSATASTNTSTTPSVAQTATTASTASGYSQPAAASTSQVATGSAAPSTAGLPAFSPEMAKMAADMMSGMSPEQLQAMTASMGAAGAGGGAGVTPPAITPEMAKMAADMMSKMRPEDMQRLSAMMGNGGMAGMNGEAGPSGLPGGASLGGMPGPDMLGRMDPKMMESAMSMMRGMDTQSLASMMLSSGMVKTQAQADAMAKQMQSMSDTQIKMMTKAAQVVQKGAQAVRKTKDFLASRVALVVAIAILLIAVLLRWYGIM